MKRVDSDLSPEQIIMETVDSGLFPPKPEVMKPVDSGLSYESGVIRGVDWGLFPVPRVI